MDKKLLHAFVITIIFLIFWQQFVMKKAPQPIEPQEVVEERIGEPSSVQKARKAVPLPSGTIEETTIEEPEDLEKAQIKNFIVSYSVKGGYIKEISLDGNENVMAFKNVGYILQDKDELFSPTIKEDRIIFQARRGRKKEYIFGEDTLVLKLDPPPSSPLVIFSNYLHPKMLDQRYQQVFYSQAKKIEQKGAKKVKPAKYGGVDFAGARDRYYCMSLVNGSYDIEWTTEEKVTHFYLESPSSEIVLYFGPQTTERLKPYGLEGVMNYGVFHIVAVGMIKLLYFMHAVAKSWGLSIILFSGMIYLILFPLTAKSSKAMRKMQQVQPEMEALKAKHKDNPQKLQKETVELYRKYKINPLGGCLPMLFQFPVFIALYQVLLRLVDLKGAHFLWIKDLSAPDRLFTLPFTIPLLKTNAFNLLPILVMILGVIQQKTMTSGSGSSDQKTMGLFMSVFIGFIFYGFPSALVLYWFTQNLLTILYQTRLSRTQALQAA